MGRRPTHRLHHGSHAHAPFVPPRRPGAGVGAVALVAAVALPVLIGNYAMVIATEIAIAAVLAASLQFGMGLGGIVSFGHAAFFGLGAYAVALAVSHLDAPFTVALMLAPMVAGSVALLIGKVVLRSHGVYAAMLTLAFAQVLWSTGDSMGRSDAAVTTACSDCGHRCLPRWHRRPRTTSWRPSIVVASLARCAGSRSHLSASRYVQRAIASCAPTRSVSDAQRTRWLAFSVGGFFAGIAGALHAFTKARCFRRRCRFPCRSTRW